MATANKTAAPQKPFVELGETGLQHFAGFIKEEFLARLDGREGVRIYKEMSDNDAVVGAELYVIDMLIRRTPWHIEPFSEDRTDLANAEFLREVQGDMSHTWTDFISEVMTMLPFGWSFFEHVFKRRRGMNGRSPGAQSKFDDARIGIRKLAIRSQDSLYRWTFDDAGGMNTFIQTPAPHFRQIEIPITKGLLFRTVVRKGNPEGRSILRNAFRSWVFKKRIEEIQGVGIARDLAGIPIGYVPPDILHTNANPANTELRRILQKVVTNLHNDKQAGILWPMVRDDSGNLMYDLKLLTTGGRAKHDITKVLQRYDTAIAMTVLADVILMGHQDVGSYSLASSKTNLFATSLGAFLDSIEETLNRHLVPRLFRLNGFPLDKLPQWKHGDVESVDLAELGTFIEKLSNAGADLFPDINLENYAREQASLPLRVEDMDLLEAEKPVPKAKPTEPEPDEVDDDDGGSE